MGIDSDFCAKKSVVRRDGVYTSVLGLNLRRARAVCSLRAMAVAQSGSFLENFLNSSGPRSVDSGSPIFPEPFLVPWSHAKESSLSYGAFATPPKLREQTTPPAPAQRVLDPWMKNRHTQLFNFGCLIGAVAGLLLISAAHVPSPILITQHPTPALDFSCSVTVSPGSAPHPLTW